MRPDLLASLARQIVVADGATGTWLMAEGYLQPGEPAEKLNLEAPEAIRRLHRLYVEAGAMLVETNSFGGNRVKLGAAGLAEQAPALNEAAARLARRAVGQDIWVAGSMGPTGKLLQPLGDLDPEEAEEAFYQQAQALLDGGADLILIETMSDLQEAAAAVRGARRAGAPVILAQMTFGPGGRTFMGVDGTAAAQELLQAGAHGVGANCGDDWDGMRLAVARMAEEVAHRNQAGAGAGGDSPGPFVSALPNAGKPRLVDGKAVYPMTPQQFAEKMLDYLNLGVRLVGGCCGTTPEHIRALAQALRRRPA